MSTWFDQWVEDEYIRIILQADYLLGKEKLVDFYYGKSLPKREEAQVLLHNLIPLLDDLLKTAQKNLKDTHPFYKKTLFSQQIYATKAYIENEVSQSKGGCTDYAQAIETQLGVTLNIPDWETQRQRLTASLKNSGYSGSTEEMFKEWQHKGEVSVLTFMEIAANLLPQLWEEARCKMLPLILSEEEADLLHETSQVKLFHLNNIWEDWPYYGGYHGAYISTIALNARLRWNQFAAKALMAHEGIPGRHLFWLIRQRMYDTAQFPAIGMLSTLASPERLIQEGIIAATPEFLWPEGLTNPKEQVAFEHLRLRTSIGLTAAIKIHHDKEDRKKVQNFIKEHALLTPGKAKAMLEIIEANPYYFPVRQLGYEMVNKLWQAYGNEFYLEIAQYRCPELLNKLYPSQETAQVTRTV